MTYTEYVDATALAQAIKAKDITPLEAVEAAIEIIKEKNDELNAVIYLREVEAIEEAKNFTDFDKPFAGVPLLIKDLGHNLEGMPARQGSKLFDGTIAKETPNFTQSFIDQGFIIIGQSHVPEFGMIYHSRNSFLGDAKNPLNTERTPGGSSSGAAAAIQSGMVHIATASDGGGSIRIPASYTGLIGLKPTRGRTPVGPHKWRSWAGAAVGFALTRSMRDTKNLLLNIQANETANPFNVTPLTEMDFEVAKEKLKDMRIAYTTKAPFVDKVSDDAIAAVEKSVEFLKNQGFTVTEVEPDIDYDALYHEYYKVTSVETASAFGGKVKKGDVELQNYVVGEYGARLSGVEYTNAIKAWDIATEEMMAFHKDYDIFITPTTTKTAPKNDKVYYSDDMLSKMEKASELDKDELESLNWDMYKEMLADTSNLQLHNITGAPAISLPLHTAGDNMPIGVQFVAPKGREDWLIELGEYFESKGQFNYYR